MYVLVLVDSKLPCKGILHTFKTWPCWSIRIHIIDWRYPQRHRSLFVAKQGQVAGKYIGTFFEHIQTVTRPWYHIDRVAHLKGNKRIGIQFSPFDNFCVLFSIVQYSIGVSRPFHFGQYLGMPIYVFQRGLDCQLLNTSPRLWLQPCLMWILIKR